METVILSVFAYTYPVPGIPDFHLAKPPVISFVTSGPGQIILVHPERLSVDTLYWYKCLNYNAFGGSCGTGYLGWAARFTIPVSLDGEMVEKVGVYIYQATNYAIGGHLCFGTQNNPGTPVVEWSFTPDTPGCFTRDLATDSVFITSGDELWVYFDTYTTGVYVASTDSGPAVVGYGDWLSFYEGEWSELIDWGFSYNWDIFVVLRDTLSLCEGSTHLPLALCVPGAVSSSSFAVSYSLPQMSYVSLILYEATGRTERAVEDGMVCPGKHDLTVRTPREAGVYFLRLESRFGVIDRKVVVVH